MAPERSASRARGRSPSRGRSSPASPQATIDLAKGFGRELWKRFAPAPFQDVFWRLRDQLGDRFDSIQIVTDDPSMPWELMRATRGKDETDFLGIDFQIARWQAGGGVSQLP